MTGVINEGCTVSGWVEKPKDLKVFLHRWIDTMTEEQVETIAYETINYYGKSLCILDRCEQCGDSVYEYRLTV